MEVHHSTNTITVRSGTRAHTRTRAHTHTEESGGERKKLRANLLTSNKHRIPELLEAHSLRTSFQDNPYRYLVFWSQQTSQVGHILHYLLPDALMLTTTVFVVHLYDK